MAIDGILNIDKPRGFTSHDVVAKLRGILGQKKIGHTGTLDPEAVGVLPVCLGSATRLCDLLTNKDKEYVAQVRLGVTTDTQDMTGRIIEERMVGATALEVEKALMSFLGDYEQIPPMFSAIKIDGKRLYELAREGKEIERKARTVQIKEIELLSVELPLLTIRVKCSKGTYIRTLCHDLGKALGCGGAMEQLERTRSGMFTKATALSLEELEGIMAKRGEKSKEEALEGILIPVDRLFSDYPALQLKPAREKLVENGNSFENHHLLPSLQQEVWPDHSQYRVYIQKDRFMGIYEYRKKEGRFCPVRMFISKQGEK